MQRLPAIFARTNATYRMLEVEQKFRVANMAEVLARLAAYHFTQQHVEQHLDTYLRHPARDFAVSGEALRIRQIGDALFVTYKGKRLESTVKIRPEIELPIAGTLAEWIELWQHLGFTIAQQVRKERRVMKSTDYPDLTVAVDRVERLGEFVEIELLIGDQNDQNASSLKVTQLAKQLRLDSVETRSYLRQILELDEQLRAR